MVDMDQKTAHSSTEPEFKLVNIMLTSGYAWSSDSITQNGSLYDDFDKLIICEMTLEERDMITFLSTKGNVYRLTDDKSSIYVNNMLDMICTYHSYSGYEANLVIYNEYSNSRDISIQFRKTNCGTRRYTQHGEFIHVIPACRVKKDSKRKARDREIYCNFDLVL